MAETYLSGFDGEGQPAKYVRLKNDNASADLVPGDVVCAQLDTATGILEVIDGTDALDTKVVGVVVGLRPIPGGGGNIPAGDYGYIQTSGFCPTVTTDGNVTDGALLKAINGAVAGVATEGTDHPFGVALRADVGTNVEAWLRNY